MIKYLELTAPEKSEYRQAKIVSIEVSEGDRVEVGDTLFRVKSGSSEIDLPATKAGVITEVIALQDENISIMTPLVLLETEVEESTATPPITEEVVEDQSAAAETEVPAVAVVQSKPKDKKTEPKAGKSSKAGESEAGHTQQSLDLDGLTPSDADPDTGADAEHSGQTPAQPAPETEVDTADAAIPEPEAQNQPTEAEKTNTMSSIQIVVPDIGSDSAKVTELLVQVGDSVAIEDPIITLESDKASMDVPSTHAGIVTAISVIVDQDVSEGDVLLEMSATDAPQIADHAVDEMVQSPRPADATSGEVDSAEAGDAAVDKSIADETLEVKIPDIGGDAARVVEVLVSIGQTVGIDDPLLTLESDKASMDVPSPAAGTVQNISVKVDDEVTEGTLIVTLAADRQAAQSTAPTRTETTASASPTPAAQQESASQQVAKVTAPANTSAPTPEPATAGLAGKAHASPSIRRFARELGVNLAEVSGTGRKGRISKGDVKQFVKGKLSGAATPSAPATTQQSGIPPIPAVDFSKFGETETQPLNRIKQLTAANVHRSWLNIPHVTHNDEADISDLESFRKQLNEEFSRQDRSTKLSPLAFIVKAVVKALQTYPQFNSSLAPDGENLILKKYYNIGIAVETPNGLVVPVIKDADTKSVTEIAEIMGELAAKARDKKLAIADMSGACFTISSLGGIGGTGFTPIVNAPEVAILGVSRSKIQPVWNGSAFDPGTVLPLSLSYDHRVIDGAEAARFTRHIATVLEDVRRLTV